MVVPNKVFNPLRERQERVSARRRVCVKVGISLRWKQNGTSRRLGRLGGFGARWREGKKDLTATPTFFLLTVWKENRWEYLSASSECAPTRRVRARLARVCIFIPAACERARGRSPACVRRCVCTCHRCCCLLVLGV